MKYKISIVLLLFTFCVTYGNERKSLELKSSTTATAYSIGATFLSGIAFCICLDNGDYNDFLFRGSFLVSVSGIVVGPSVGHFYAGNTKRGLMSAGFRAISTGTFLWSSFGLLSVVSDVHDANFENEDLYLWGTIISGAATFGSIVFDIWTCPNSVEKYNRSARDYRGFYLSPEIDIEHESYGLSLSYRF